MNSNIAPKKYVLVVQPALLLFVDTVNVKVPFPFSILTSVLYIFLDFTIDHINKKGFPGRSVRITYVGNMSVMDESEIRLKTRQCLCDILSVV